MMFFVFFTQNNVVCWAILYKKKYAKASKQIDFIIFYFLQLRYLDGAA